VGLQVRIFIVVALLVLEFFRLPLFAFIGIRSMGPVLHILVFLSPLLLYKKFSLNFRGFGPFILVTVWSLVSTILFLAKGMSLGAYSSTIAPITTPFLLVFGILVFSNDVDSWRKVARWVLAISFYLGSMSLIAEWLVISKLNLISQCDWASFVANSFDSQYCNTNRFMPVGFFVYKDMSLAILLGGFFAFSNWKNKWEVALRVALVLFSLWIVDSIVLTGIFLVVSVIRFYVVARRNLLLYATSLLLIFLNLFSYSRSFYRLRDYLVNELNLHNFIPSTGGCSDEFWLFQLDGASEYCSSKEIHSLLSMFRFGVLGTLSWYLSLAVMFIIFCYDWIKRRPITTLMYFPIVFIFNASHYSGIESWGVNYLSFIIFYVYLSERSVNLPSTGKG
tara:strand:- start:945 stop:2120 length:1176 start_codon:yes stop_codon:yes gene_type:complete